MLSQLNNVTIGKKLTAVQALSGAVLVAIAAYAAVQLEGAQQRSEGIYSQLVSVGDLGAVYEDAVEMRLDTANMALADAAGAAEMQSKVAEHEATLDTEWKAYQASDPQASDALRTAAWKKILEWRQAREQLKTLALADDDAGYAAVRDAKVTPAANAAFDALDGLQKAEAAAALAMSDDGASAFSRSLTWFVALTLLGLGLGTGLSQFISRGITTRLRALVGVTQGLAAGRLDQRTGLGSRDEVGQLAEATDASIAQLSTVVSTITARAESLTTSSQDLSVDLGAAVQRGAGVLQPGPVGGGRLRGDLRLDGHHRCGR